MDVITQAPARTSAERQSPAVALSRAITPGQVYLCLALGLALVALVLRLWNIERESLWLDEGYTLLFSQLRLDRLFLVGGAHEHPPLYYLIVHALLSIWDSYLVPRMVAAVAGSLSVVVLYALGAKLFTPGAGLIAAALLTIAPFHLWYSQDGRAYELAGLLVLLSYLLALRALERPGPLLWCLYGACTAAALYTEYTTALVLLPQLLLLRPAVRPGARAALIRSWLVVGMLFAPWIVTLFLDAQSIAGNYWIPAPTVDSVVNTVLIFLNLRTPCPTPPCSGHEVAFPLLMGHETLVAAGAMVAVAAVLLAALRSRNVRLGMVTLWLVMPFAVILLIAIRRSLYLDRVFLDATFAFYLLLGAGVSNLRKRWWIQGPAAATAMIVLLAALANFQPLYAEPTNPDWKSTVRDFRAAYRPGQAVVYNPGALRALVAAYLPPGWHASREAPLWFHNYLDVPGWEQRYAAVGQTLLHDSSRPLLARYARYDNVLRNDELSAAARGMRQVWLITQDYSGLTDTRRWFVTHGFHLLLSQLYSGDSRLELWDRLLPAQLGPAVAPDTGFGRGWSPSGTVEVMSGVARADGPAGLERSFPILPGTAYTVNVEYRGIPPAHPSVWLQTYDRRGHPVGSMVDRFGQLLDSFPRTEWYDLPVNGVWLAQPFGFVAPPGAARATLRLRNQLGTCYWRHVAVYREKGVPFGQRG